MATFKQIRAFRLLEKLGDSLKSSKDKLANLKSCYLNGTISANKARRIYEHDIKFALRDALIFEKIYKKYLDESGNAPETIELEGFKLKNWSRDDFYPFVAFFEA